MRLVQVIGCGNYDGVHLIELEQILDVGEHVGDLQSLRDGTCLRSVIVAERNELGAFELGQHRKMRKLRDRPRADEAEADIPRCLRFLTTDWRFGQSSSPDSRSLESYDNSGPRARVRSRPTGTFRFRGHN